jgi:hypothetical protein
MPTKLSALVAGFFAGFLAPYLAFAALLATFQYRDTSGQVTMPGWFMPVPYLTFMAMPLLAGFRALGALASCPPVNSDHSRQPTG